MKFYVADANASASEIDVIDRSNPKGGYALDPRWDLGEGFGATRIAIALIADALDDERTLKHYEAFRNRVLLPLEGRAWELSQEDIRQEVLDLEMTERNVQQRRRGGIFP